MDNRIFNVNGAGRNALESAIALAVSISGSKVRAFSSDSEKGLVFYWSDSENKAILLPPGITNAVLADISMEWLKGDDAKKVKSEGWDADHQHDGHNTLGWRVYCEDWGHVGSSPYAIIAIRPAYMWHGK